MSNDIKSKAAKRHKRRTRLRAEKGFIRAVEFDDMKRVQDILYAYPALVYTESRILQMCESEDMWLFLFHMGARCSFWTYECGNSIAAYCVKKYTEIRT